MKRVLKAGKFFVFSHWFLKNSAYYIYKKWTQKEVNANMQFDIKKYKEIMEHIDEDEEDDMEIV